MQLNDIIFMSVMNVVNKSLGREELHREVDCPSGETKKGHSRQRPVWAKAVLEGLEGMLEMRLEGKGSTGY